jgi:hypothetical protein
MGRRPRNPTLAFRKHVCLKIIKSLLVYIDIDTHPGMKNSASHINEINTRAVLLMQQSKHKKEAILCLRNGIKLLLAHHVDDERLNKCE